MRGNTSVWKADCDMELRQGVINLEFLTEPAFLVDFKGEIRGMNSSAMKAFGKASSLIDISAGDREDVLGHLRQASKSTSPHLGSLKMTQGVDVVRYRAASARTQWPGCDENMLIIRLMPNSDGRFDMLKRRIKEI
ncbi:hypothetical protein ACOI1H_21420, partial [Loktanella sp. DJP18]|uniref:hypothetical protein n=1 Tax=Loktanella sp. DJP18 TaxID=3409788 RepID=UPI003BB6432B